MGWPIELFRALATIHIPTPPRFPTVTSRLTVSFLHTLSLVTFIPLTHSLSPSLSHVHCSLSLARSHSHSLCFSMAASAEESLGPPSPLHPQTASPPAQPTRLLLAAASLSAFERPKNAKRRVLHTDEAAFLAGACIRAARCCCFALPGVASPPFPRVCGGASSWPDGCSSSGAQQRPGYAWPASFPTHIILHSHHRSLTLSLSLALSLSLCSVHTGASGSLCSL